jgi:hypothetical protein
MHSSKLVIGAICLVAAGVMPANAQSVGGKYTVAGKNFDGAAYTGTAQIAPSGSTCRITWQTAGTTSEGLCMLSNKTLAAFYKLGSTYGLVLYDLHPNGTLVGKWTIADKQGLGTEILTPAR